MPTVYLYRFRGTFRGQAEFDFKFPEPGATHEGLAFVLQNDEVRDDDVARTACLRYGFAEVEILKAGSIDPASLERENNAPMKTHVRLAFERGASVVWYTD